MHRRSFLATLIGGLALAVVPIVEIVKEPTKVYWLIHNKDYRSLTLPHKIEKITPLPDCLEIKCGDGSTWRSYEADDYWHSYAERIT